MGLGLGMGLGLSNRNSPAAIHSSLENFSHELLLPLEILTLDGDASQGAIISALRYPWEAIFDQLKSNPQLLFEFSKHPREFEEFIASTYHRKGFKVVLTPRSGDGGTDVIAEKTGVGAIRILDQCKAFSKGRKVGMNDVRAMMGTLKLNTDFDNRRTKAVITTTSTFAPTAKVEWAKYIPRELELRDNTSLVSWLSDTK